MKDLFRQIIKISLALDVFLLTSCLRQGWSVVPTAKDARECSEIWQELVNAYQAEESTEDVGFSCWIVGGEHEIKVYGIKDHDEQDKVIEILMTIKSSKKTRTMRVYFLEEEKLETQTTEAGTITRRRTDEETLLREVTIK